MMDTTGFILVYVLTSLETLISGSSVGTEFLLAFADPPSGSGSLVIGAYIISNTQPFTVDVEESGVPRSTTLTNIHNFEAFDVSNVISSTGISSQVVRVTASESVSVYGVVHRQDRGSVFSLIPVSALGQEYYAVTYCHATSQPCFINVIGTQPNTDVNVVLPTSQSVNVEFDGVAYTSGDTINFILDKDEVAHIQSSVDLTGTRVMANEDIAVFSGGMGTGVPDGGEGFFMQQVPAVSTWGREHVTVLTPGRSDTGDYYRILTSQPDTLISISGESPFIIPDTDHWIQRRFSQTNTKYIHSDKPLMVVRLSLSEVHAYEPGFPTMVVLVPNEQFNHGIDTVMPRLSATPTNTMTVVTRSKHTSSILLEGSTISGWTGVDGSDYKTVELTANLDYNTISTTHASAQYAVYAYGHGSLSAAFSGSRNYTVINPACTVSTMSVGDEVDNDCDGLVDEDTCTPTDTAGKDCAVIISGERDVHGTQFVFAFPLHTTTSTQHIYVSAPVTGVEVTLWQPLMAGTIEAVTMSGRSHVFQLSSLYQINTTDVSDKTLYVTSASEMSAIALSSELSGQLSSGAFRLLPVDGLGKEYIAVTYCETNDCFLVISAPHPETDVNVRLKLIDETASVTFGGTTYDHGDVITIHLMQYQSARIAADVDMTGTWVSCNKPVSVISGGRLSKVVKGNNQDMLVEQMMPVQSLGYTVPVVQVPGRVDDSNACPGTDCKDFIRIVASQDSTSVSLIEYTPEVYTLAFKGDFVDIEVNATASVESDKPISVMQLLKDGPIKYDGGMNLCPPVEQYTTSDLILIPEGTDIGIAPFFGTNLVVITNQSATGNTLYNDTTFTTWSPLAPLEMAAASVIIGSGLVNITGVSGTGIGGHVSINILQFAPGSFVFPLAFMLNDIFEACVLSVSSPGDGVDNDCDGGVDEENCTDSQPQDEDNDGMFNEDCLSFFEESSLWPSTVYTTGTPILESSVMVSSSESTLLETTTILDPSTAIPPLPSSDSILPAPDTFLSNIPSSDVISPGLSPSMLPSVYPASDSLISPFPVDSVTVSYDHTIDAYPSISLYYLISVDSLTISDTTIDTYLSAPIDSETSSISFESMTLPEASPITTPASSSASITPTPMTTEQASVPATTATSPMESLSPSVAHSCTCICSTLTLLDQSSLVEVVASIRRELIVDKETVSQTIRKKTSAPDHRPSAVSMGYVGIAVISSLFLGIFVLDAGSLFRDLVSLVRVIKDSCKGTKHESRA